MKNPDSGLSYIHVVPDDYGAYVDVFNCLTSLAKRRAWTSVISPEVFKSMIGTAAWGDPSNLFIVWDQHAGSWPEVRTPRRCKLAYVFAEALAYDESKMLDLHRCMFQKFTSFYIDVAPEIVFAHNQSVSDLLHNKISSCVAAVLPVGYDETAMGKPADIPYGMSDFHEFSFWGSPTPRREVYSLFFERHLPGFIKLPSSFGKSLLKEIRRSRAAFHIAHSLVTTFSTWRSWQCASTNAALIVEDDGNLDARWPFLDHHVIKIPVLTAENALAVAEDLKKLSHDKMLDVAKAAHEEVARRYTVDYIEDRFLTPVASLL